MHDVFIKTTELLILEDEWIQTEKARSGRTIFSAQQQKVLEDLYQRGMVSKGQISSHLHQEAVERTGLDKQRVLDWIGNHNKQVNERSYSYPKTFYEKGMSGFNMFIHEKKAEVGGMQSWASCWKALPEEDKQSYKLKAKEFQPEQCDTRKKALHLLTKVGQMLKELKAINVDLVCLGMDLSSQDNILIGEGKTAKFFKERPELISKLYSCYEFEATEAADKKTDIKELRKICQEHMNKLYTQATGKEGSFPYKSVAAGELLVAGLPSRVLPLKPMSTYGEAKLKLILETASISVNTHPAGEVSTETSIPVASTSQLPQDAEAVNISPREMQQSVEALKEHPSTSAAQTLLQEVDSEVRAELEEIVEKKSELVESFVSADTGLDLEVDNEDVKPQKQKSEKRKKKGTVVKTKKNKKRKTTLPGFWTVEAITGIDNREGENYFHIKWKGCPEEEMTGSQREIYLSAL